MKLTASLLGLSLISANSLQESLSNPEEWLPTLQNLLTSPDMTKQISEEVNTWIITKLGFNLIELKELWDAWEDFNNTGNFNYGVDDYFNVNFNMADDFVNDKILLDFGFNIVDRDIFEVNDEDEVEFNRNLVEWTYKVSHSRVNAEDSKQNGAFEAWKLSETSELSLKVINWLTLDLDLLSILIKAAHLDMVTNDTSITAKKEITFYSFLEPEKANKFNSFLYSGEVRYSDLRYSMDNIDYGKALEINNILTQYQMNNPPTDTQLQQYFNQSTTYTRVDAYNGSITLKNVDTRTINKPNNINEQLAKLPLSLRFGISTNYEVSPSSMLAKTDDLPELDLKRKRREIEVEIEDENSNNYGAYVYDWNRSDDSAYDYDEDEAYSSNEEIAVAMPDKEPDYEIPELITENPEVYASAVPFVIPSVDESEYTSQDYDNYYEDPNADNATSSPINMNPISIEEAIQQLSEIQIPFTLDPNEVNFQANFDVISLRKNASNRMAEVRKEKSSSVSDISYVDNLIDAWVDDFKCHYTNYINPTGLEDTCILSVILRGKLNSIVVPSVELRLKKGLSRYPKNGETPTGKQELAKILYKLNGKQQSAYSIERNYQQEFFDVTSYQYHYNDQGKVDPTQTTHFMFVRLPTDQRLKNLVKKIETFLLPFFSSAMKLVENPSHLSNLDIILEEFLDQEKFNILPILNDILHFGVAIPDCDWDSLSVDNLNVIEDDSYDYFGNSWNSTSVNDSPAFQCNYNKWISADQISDELKEKAQSLFISINSQITDTIDKIVWDWKRVRSYLETVIEASRKLFDATKDFKDDFTDDLDSELSDATMGLDSAIKEAYLDVVDSTEFLLSSDFRTDVKTAHIDCISLTVTDSDVADKCQEDTFKTIKNTKDKFISMLYQSYNTEYKDDYSRPTSWNSKKSSDLDVFLTDDRPTGLDTTDGIFDNLNMDNYDFNSDYDTSKYYDYGV